MNVINQAYLLVIQKLNTITSLVNTPLLDNPPHRKVLLIHCHPSPESYSTALSSAVHDGLVSAGHEVRVRRLYVHNNKSESYDGKTFDPVLSLEDKKHYITKDPIESRSTPEDLMKLKVSKSVIEAIEDIRWCNSLVFVYPTWWLNFPAILKGYFDRVMQPGVAFRLPNRENPRPIYGLVPLLTNINKIGVVTTYGGSGTVVFAAGDNPRRFISRSFRALCAPGCQLHWSALYEVDKDQASREKFLAQVKADYSKF